MPAFGVRASSFQCLNVITGASTSMAPPCPPPMQMVAMPRLPPACGAGRAAGAARCARRGADRVAERDGAAVDVELAPSSAPSGAARPSCSGSRRVLPGLEAADDLGGEGFVDFPGVEVVEAEAVALQDGRRGMHRAEAHLRRIEAGPLRCRRCADRLRPCFSTASLEASTSQAAPSVICELLPGVMLPYFLSKKGLSLASPAMRGIAAHAVVGGIHLAVASISGTISSA
jgi:hypothetical protein